MTSQPDAPRSTTPSASPYPRASAWVGWIAFAAVCMMLLGSFHVMQGLVAIVDSDYFPAVGHGPVTDISLTAWGWVHLLGERSSSWPACACSPARRGRERWAC